MDHHLATTISGSEITAKILNCSVMFPLTYDFEGATRFPAPNPVDVKAFCGANGDNNMDFRVVEYEIYRVHF